MTKRFDPDGRVLTEISRSLRAFERNGRLLLRAPVGEMLQGIYFDSSSFSKQLFYPTVFVQPLFVPKDHMLFTYGGRLSGRQGRGWELADDNQAEVLQDLKRSIQTQAMPFLERIQEPIDLAIGTEHYPPELPEQFRWPSNDINVLEAATYAWFLSSDRKRSLRAIEKIQSQFLVEKYDTNWAQDLLDRVTAFKELVKTNDHRSAIERLSTFRLQTANALGLTQYLNNPS